jgi:hypothetical protein
MSAVLFRTTRRVIAASVVLGCLAEFLVWVTTYTANSDPYTAGEYPWLDRLQEPGVRFGIFFGLHVWRAFGRPEYHLLFYAYVGSVSSSLSRCCRSRGVSYYDGRKRSIRCPSLMRLDGRCCPGSRLSRLESRLAAMSGGPTSRHDPNLTKLDDLRYPQ